MEDEVREAAPEGAGKEAAVSAVEDATIAEQDANEIRQLITDGAMDGQLEKLEWAIRDRKRKLGDEMRAELAVGDRVKLTETCRPKYLQGHVATITKVRTSGRELVIDFGYRIGRYGPITEVNRSMVEPVID